MGNGIIWLIFWLVCVELNGCVFGARVGMLAERLI